MSEFDGQHALHRELCQRRPGLQAGMALVLRQLGTKPHGSRWRDVNAINWIPVLDRWVAWVNNLLNKHRPPGECEVLWFETPSVMNTSATSVAAYAHLGPASDAYGTEDPCAWPAGRDKEQIEDWIFHLPELDRLLAESKWSHAETETDSDAATHAAMSGALAISHACALLLILNGLPKTKAGSFLSHPSGVAAILGWTDGGVMPIGQLKRGKWLPIRRARPKPLVLSAVSADERMVLAMYQPRRFVSLGGDLNQPDNDGETALTLSAFSTPAEVRALLEAGADASLRGPKGESVLHRFGSCEIETLRRLVKHGADPHALNDAGESITTRLVWDGRCSAHHLRFYESLGVRLPTQGQWMTHAMACLASASQINAGSGARRRSVLKWLTGIGHDVNARDEHGRSPLWLALEMHAKTMDAYRSSSEDYEHDRTAELLLEFGADPRVKHPDGLLPLIPRGAVPLMVQRYDDTRLVQALLRHGADPLARCALGLTALDYAKQAAAEPRMRGNEGAAKCAAILERAMQVKRPRTPNRRDKL